MKRKFVTNLILLLFLNLLVKPFYIFGIDRTVQNLVGDESYGLYFALFNFSLLLNIILDVGITSFNNRNISQHSFLLKKHLSHIVGLKFILAGIYAILCLLVAFIIGYNSIQFHLLFFLIINQFLSSFILYLRSNISGLQLFRTDSIISVLDRIILIIICGGIILYTDLLNGDLGIKWFVYAQTLAYGLTVIITFVVVLSRSGKIRIQIDPVFLLTILRKSYPYALLILLMSLYNRLDSVMLERLLPDPLGKEQAGVYAQSFRLLDAVSNFGLLFSALLLPIFSKMLKTGESIGQMLKLSYSLIIVPALIVAVSCIFYNQEIMELLYHSVQEENTEILGILMTGFIGIATTYIFGTLLTANGSLKQLNIMALCGMLLNISLNLILIPRYLAYGAAYSSLITQIATAASQVIIALYIFKLKTGYRFFILFSAFIGGTIVLAFVSRNFDSWGTGYIFLIASASLLAFLLRLLNLKDLYKIIRYE